MAQIFTYSRGDAIRLLVDPEQVYIVERLLVDYDTNVRLYQIKSVNGNTELLRNAKLIETDRFELVN